MTKYCIDLIKEEIRLGNNVSLLWPGQYINSSIKSKIKKRKSQMGIENYELINAMPVPLLDGIAEPKWFLSKKDESPYIEFLKREKFDAVHIHTLMGLPQEFIVAANYLGVQTVFTSHDYFGICMNGSLMYGSFLCENDNNCEKCVRCCKAGLSINKIRILQSSLYRRIKEWNIVKRLRSRHIGEMNDLYNDEETYREYEVKAEVVQEYALLRKYYVDMLQRMDVLHFNSEQTRSIYNRYFTTSKQENVISISNAMVEDKRKIKIYRDNIRFGYLGPIDVRKGFYQLIELMDSLYEQGYQNFELQIYSLIKLQKPYLKMHDVYNAEELDKVMSDIDTLIVPSIWYETFGFTVLEALSQGVPVIVSDYVGAKDIVQSRVNGFVYHNGKDGLENILKYILVHPEVLPGMNQNIVKFCKVKTMRQHALEIIGLYSKGN